MAMTHCVIEILNYEGGLMFLQIFLVSVVLLVASLIGEAIVFCSVWKNFDDHDEVLKRIGFYASGYGECSGSFGNDCVGGTQIFWICELAGTNG